MNLLQNKEEARHTHELESDLHALIVQKGILSPEVTDTPEKTAWHARIMLSVRATLSDRLHIPANTTPDQKRQIFRAEILNILANKGLKMADAPDEKIADVLAILADNRR